MKTIFLRQLPAAIVMAGLSALAALNPVEAATMKAIQYAEYGPSSVLQYVDVKRPQPAAGEVLVKIRAAGVNPVDWKNRLGAIPGLAPSLPIIPGYEFAGDIAALGAGVKNRKIGEHVFAMLPLNAPRAYAQYISVPSSDAVTAPRKIDATQAAVLPLTALTAYQALFDAGKLQRGQTVLIQGASGGVGHLAVQMAKKAGAKVIGTASTTNIEFLKSIGVDVAIDYKTQRFEDYTKNVDLVFDTVGGDTLTRSYEVVKRGGVIVSIAGDINSTAATQHGFQAVNLFVHPDPHELKIIAEWVEQGVITPEIETTFPLHKAAAAHDHIQSHHSRGRIALNVDTEQGTSQ